MTEKFNEEQDVKPDKVRVIPIEFIDDFPDHPFLVKDDESMKQLIEYENGGAYTAMIYAEKLGKQVISLAKILD